MGRKDALKIKVLLVEDHVVVREAFRSRLEKEPDMVVVGEAGNGQEAVEMAQELKPTVILMDIGMEKLNGIEATRIITARHPRIKVLPMSMQFEKSVVTNALKAGAKGFLLKKGSAAEMVEAIRVVASNRVYLTPDVANWVVEGLQETDNQPDQSLFSKLTSREREVLQLLVEGHSSKEAAEILQIAKSTIETHRRQIKKKLKVESFALLVKIALKEGITSLEA